MLIRSNLLKLRTTKDSDLSYVIDAENDKENTPYIGSWSFEQHLYSLTNPDMRHLIIEDQDGNRVGYAILTGLTDSNKAICIKRVTIQEKGKGYGKETLRLVIEWAFEHTETHRLSLDVKDFNSRPRHVYEAAGFIFEGTLRDCIYNGTRYESLSVMSILRDEYESRNPR